MSIKLHNQDHAKILTNTVDTIADFIVSLTSEVNIPFTNN